MTPTAIACRKAVNESGRQYIHTDVYLEYRKELAPGGATVVIRTGLTVSLPQDLLEQLGGFWFRYWLDWVTAALLESEAVDGPTIERFYQALGTRKEGE
jgi:hypothetical protein